MARLTSGATFRRPLRSSTCVDGSAGLVFRPRDTFPLLIGCAYVHVNACSEFGVFWHFSPDGVRHVNVSSSSRWCGQRRGAEADPGSARTRPRTCRVRDRSAEVVRGSALHALALCRLRICQAVHETGSDRSGAAVSEMPRRSVRSGAVTASHSRRSLRRRLAHVKQVNTCWRRPSTGNTSK